jgi:hypothetical protein
MISFGDECLMLKIKSPQTYVCRNGGYVMSAPAHLFAKELLCNTQDSLKKLALKCSNRLKQLTDLSLQKYEISNLVNTRTSDMRFAAKQEKRVEALIDMRFPVAASTAK